MGALLIPDVEEMEALFASIPDVDEMEALTAPRARAARPKKAPRPCAYGERDPETGRCPPKPRKPRAAKAKTVKAKAPCKYGPRDPVTGRCPKKSFLQEFKESQVKAAVGTGMSILTAEKHKELRQEIVQFLKIAGVPLLKATGIAGAVVGAIALGVKGGQQAKKQRDDEITRQAFDAYVAEKGALIHSGKWDQSMAGPLIDKWTRYFNQQALRFVSAGGK